MRRVRKLMLLMLLLLNLSEVKEVEASEYLELPNQEEAEEKSQTLLNEMVIEHMEEVTKKEKAYEERLSSRNLTYDIYTTSNLLKSDFDKMLKGTPMAGTGEYFERLEEEYGINGVFAIAVAEKESSLGLHQANRNNVWGRRATGGGWMSWNSLGESILSFGGYMNTSRYKGKSIESVGKIYCPPTYESWTIGVRSLMTKRYSLTGL